MVALVTASVSGSKERARPGRPSRILAIRFTSASDQSSLPNFVTWIGSNPRTVPRASRAIRKCTAWHTSHTGSRLEIRAKRSSFSPPGATAR